MRILRVFASAILAFCCASANASLVLKIDNGVDDAIIIVDNELVGGESDDGFEATHVDANAGEGLISFFGTLGDWMIITSLGSSKPAIGPPGQLDLEFSAFSLIGASPGSLVIMLTDTGFDDPFGNPFHSITGTTHGRVHDIDVGFGEDDEEFGITDVVDTPREYNNPGAVDELFSFSGGGSGEFFSELEDTFSLSQTITITHTTVGQSTTFSSSLFIPEPATLALLGLGLVGLGFSRHRRV